jgi:hypothetical protein
MKKMKIIIKTFYFMVILDFILSLIALKYYKFYETNRFTNWLISITSSIEIGLFLHMIIVILTLNIMFHIFDMIYLKYKNNNVRRIELLFYIVILTFWTINNIVSLYFLIL